MILTTTSIAFILLSLGLAFCGWEFWRVSCRTEHDSGEQTNWLVTFYFIFFAVQNSILGVGTLFFADNPRFLFWVLIATDLFLIVPCIIGIFAVYHIFFPKRSSYPLIVLSGVLAIAGLIVGLVALPQPFMTPQNGIDWNMPFSLSLIMFYLLFISIGTSFYIFLRLFRLARNREIRLFSLVMVIVASIGLVDSFVRFILLHGVDYSIRTNLYDIGVSLIGIIFILFFVFWPYIQERLRRV